MENSAEVLVIKDITKADDPVSKLEVERFWACFMFLYIMPPKHRDTRGNPIWRARTLSSQPYIAQCRYDEFIINHATSCEHGTNYFIHYHRNLLSKFQLALNEADYALRNPNDSEEMNLVRFEVRGRRLDRDLDQAIDYYQDLISRLSN